MLGRGMVARPTLALEIAALDAAKPVLTLDWAGLLPFIADFWLLVKQHLTVRQQAGRLKQWLYLLQRSYPQAQQAFAAVRTLHDPAHVDAWMFQHRAALEN
jgi:tRNA-dihydrouridine synthase C